MRGVDRVFHVAGLTSLRASADTHVRASTSAARGSCSRRRCGPASSASVHTSSVAAVGPAPRGSTADETQVFRAGRYGLPYVNAKHEAEMEALRLAAHGLPVVVVNPAHVFGAGDLHRSSTELVRRFLRGQIPAYVDGALNIVDAEDVARGHLLADERGEVGERYILGNRNFTLDRLFADLGRLSGVEPPALKLPLPAALALARGRRAAPGPAGGDHGRGPRVVAVVGVPLDQGQARARLEARPTTRTRCRRRSTGTASASPARLEGAGRAPAARAARRRPRPAHGGRDAAELRALMSATLHRCRTPTDWLCPCGRVARELRRRGVDYEEVRVPWRKRDRPEIEQLSGQRHVPLLVIDGDAICDSPRIVEHLEWRRSARS